MSKQPPFASFASAIGPCPTIIQIVRRPGTGRFLFCLTLNSLSMPLNLRLSEITFPLRIDPFSKLYVFYDAKMNLRKLFPFMKWQCHLHDPQPELYGA